MFALIDVLQGPAGTRLVAVLLHSLWQAAGLALLTAAALRFVPALRAELRYRISLGALALVVISPFLTWSFLGPAWNGDPDTAFASAGNSPHEMSQNGVHSHDHGETDSHSTTPTRAMPGRAAPDRWFGVPKRVVPVLLVAWLIGAVVMLVRTAAHLHAARQLQSGIPVADPRLLELVEEVACRLGLRRAVRVLVAGDLASPVVCGVWTPALVVPLSFLTGLTPDQQYAVVAHELAHIRRGDFLVNVLQLVVESILFFNPAVLWLSRQVRIEREACCDAIAVSLTDAPIEYVQTLADWAERMMTPAPTPFAAALGPAFAEPAEGGSLGDRVRRVLAPTRAPHLRVRWGTFAGLLAAVAVAIGLIARGTDWAVAQAAKALSDEERVQIVAEARREVPVEDDADLRNGKPVRVTARVRTWDGKPVNSFHVSLQSQSRNSGYSNGMTLDADGKLDTEIEGGRLKGAIGAIGYAPVLFAERPAPGGTEVDFGEVVLPAGRSARIRFVDPQGRPVRADRISAAPTAQNSRPVQDIRADENGDVLLQNIIDAEYQVAARAAGFQPVYDWKGPLPATGVTTIAMTPARVTEGIIRDRDGSPIPDVQIYVSREQSGPGHSGYSYGHGFPGQLWTQSGPDGSFRIDQMANDGRADFVLMKDGAVQGLVQDVESGQTSLVWTLDPVITVRGRFEGDLDLINKVPRYRSVFFSIYRNDRSGHREQVQATSFPVQPDGSFEIKGIVSGTLEIKLAYARWNQVVTGPIEGVVIPLVAPEKPGTVTSRPLTLLFSHDGQSVVPGGRVMVESAVDRRNREPYPITTRETRIEIGSTGQMTIDGSQLLGFAFEKSTRQSFQVADLGTTLVVPVVPAGAIRGTVLDHAGQPLPGATVRASLTGARGFPNVPEEVPTNAAGEFLLSPVPLQGTANVTAGIGRVRIISAPLELSAADPSQSVTFQMPRLVSARVRAVDVEGRPVAAVPLAIEVTVRNAKTSSSHGFGVVAHTDHEGMATIEGLGENLADYTLFAPSRGPWLHQLFHFTAGTTTEIQLRQGKVVSGVVLDDSGEPLAGVSVLASLTGNPSSPAMPSVFEPEDKTDAEGRFRFSNLPDVPIRLNPIGVTIPPSVGEIPVPPGSDVTLQGAPQEWVRKASDRARSRKSP